MTAEFWQYDSRLGRRFNIDCKVVVWESSYACFRNNPIFNSDLKGDSSGAASDLPICTIVNERAEVSLTTIIIDGKSKLVSKVSYERQTITSYTSHGNGEITPEDAYTEHIEQFVNYIDNNGDIVFSSYSTITNEMPPSIEGKSAISRSSTYIINPKFDSETSTLTAGGSKVSMPVEATALLSFAQISNARSGRQFAIVVAEAYAAQISSPLNLIKKYIPASFFKEAIKLFPNDWIADPEKIAKNGVTIFTGFQRTVLGSDERIVKHEVELTM